MAMDTKVSDLLRLLEERLASIDRAELMTLLAAKSKHHHNYSINNLILAGIQLCRQQGKPFDLETFSNLELAPFPIWQKWRYRIKRGSKALNILVPFIKTKVNPEAEKRENGKDNKKRIVGFGIRSVFDISQTEKFTANDNALHRSVSTRTARIDYSDLISRIEAAGLRIVSVPLREGEGGHISSNVITINRNNSMEAKYCTLLHELSHYCLGHTAAGNNQERSVEELEAEATAFVVGNQLGIDIPAEFYIAAWAGDGQKIRKSLSRIERAAEKVSGIIGLNTMPASQAAA